MSRKLSSAFLTAFAAAAITFSTVQSSQADDTQRVRIRGVVESLNGDVLTIKTRDGSDQSIAMQCSRTGFSSLSRLGRAHS